MARDRSLLRLEKLRTQRSRADGDMLKHRLSKFKSIFSSVATSGKLSEENFLLHLKECEFRHNNSKDTKELYHILLKMIRENPIKFN